MTRSAILTELRSIDARVYRPPLSPSESTALIQRRRVLLQMLAAAQPTIKSPQTAVRLSRGTRGIYNGIKVQR